MTTQEFKKQTGKYLGAKIRELGFKGSGFNYIMDSDNYVFTIGIQANRYGGSFCVELGVHPKKITSNGFEDLDFKKLKYYNCEFRTRLAREGKGDKWWNYTNSESKNLQLIDEVLIYIEKYALPIIDGFIKDKDLLEKVKITDLKNRFIPIPDYKSGLTPIISDIRLAWVLAVVLEDINHEKSFEFAKYALSNDKSPSNFFGNTDLQRILKSYNYSSGKGKTSQDKMNFWTRLTGKLKNK